MRPDLLGWHQELCSESIGLIFCYLPAGFSILVHDQVSDFVGNTLFRLFTRPSPWTTVTSRLPFP